MAGMLRCHRRGYALTNPVHKLHNIFKDVVFADLAMWADDMRQQPLRANPGRCLIGDLLAWVVERLAVEVAPDDRAVGPEEARVEALSDAAGRCAVGEREQASAEIDQDECVVIGVGWD